MTRRRGSRISLDPRTVGGAPRAGTILEVLGAPDRPRYRVRWDDGRESIVAQTGEVGSRARRPARPRKRPEPATAPRLGLTAEPGDRLVIRAHFIDEPQRDAEILEALGPDGRPPFRVRWEDTGAESLFYPGSDAFVEHLAGTKSR